MIGSGIGLLLIGHGASKGGGGPVRRLAERLRGLGRFDQVAACFWKEKPFAGDGLALMNTPTIVAVPVFATEGRIAKEMIPAALGLSGELTRLGDGRQVHYLHPVGVHSGLADLALARAVKAARAAGFDPAATGLLLIAHGNRQGGGARTSAENLALLLSQGGVWDGVKTLFLEEAPLASDWQNHMTQQDIVVLPLLLAEGQHAARDVAPLFGLPELGTEEPVLARFAGRRLAIAHGLADDQALADLIVRMVEEALSRPSP